MMGEITNPAWLRRLSWLCFVYSAIVPAAAYLFTFLYLGADAAQAPLVMMVLLLGFLFAWALPPRVAITPMRAAAMATAGLFIGWLVAVVMTWGFALLGAWVLPAYAGACYLGRRIRTRLSA